MVILVMKIFKKFKELINFLYVFSIVNDNFIVNIFGDTSLKFIFIFFLIVNIQALFSFNLKNNSNKPFLLLMVMMFISYMVNVGNYVDLQQPILSIFSIFFIYIVSSSIRTPQNFIQYYLVSVLFSALLCVTTDVTINEFTFRKTGGTSDPNEFSVMILTSIGFWVTSMVTTKSITKRIMNVVSLFVCLLAILMAGSKSGLVTLFLIFFIYFCSLFKKYPIKKTFKYTSLFVCCLLILGVIFFNHYSDTLINILGRFDDHSTAGQRFLSWNAGIDIWMNNPLLGVGPQNYVHMISEHFPYIEEGSRAAHNLFIQAMVEVGVLGFAILIIFLYYPIRKCFSSHLQIEYALGVFTIIIMGITLSLLFEKYLWLYFGLICNPYISQISYQKSLMSGNKTI